MVRFRIAFKQGSIIAWVSVAVVVLAAGCSFPGSVRNVVKIGLVAPFEGPQRNMAYDVLFAARIAVGRYNAAVADEPSESFVELVALNDDGRPAESRQQARELAVDPDIVGVVGPWTADAAVSAMDTYRAAGLAVALPDAANGDRFPALRGTGGVVEIPAGQSADKDLAEGFRALTGRDPGTQAIQAYQGTSRLLAAVRRAAPGWSRPTRADVRALIENPGS